MWGALGLLTDYTMADLSEKKKVKNKSFFYPVGQQFETPDTDWNSFLCDWFQPDAQVSLLNFQ